MRPAPADWYAVAIGSNRRGRAGGPRDMVRAAAALLGGRCSRLYATTPLGPSDRRFCNAVCIVPSDLAPPAMLARLKAIERDFGRRGGQRWGARVLDLDIVLWSGGRWRSRTLTVPHMGFRTRRFVLDPLADVAGEARDPVTGRSVRQMRARLTAARPLPRRAGGAGP